MAKNETSPLLEISLELAGTEIAWLPEIGVSNGGDGIRDMFNGWITSFVNIGNLVKRLDVVEGSYIKELTEDYFVSNAICQVIEIVLRNERECTAFRESYSKFAYLWTHDLQVLPPRRPLPARVTSLLLKLGERPSLAEQTLSKWFLRTLACVGCRV